VGFVRRHRLLTAAAIVVVAVLSILSATAVAVWREAHTDEARRVDEVDLIAVLGAAEYNGNPSPVFQGRLRHALALYREGFANKVLVLGGNKPGDVTTEAAAGQSWLIDEGIPEIDVLASPTGSNTLDSMRAAAQFMRREGMRSVFLVSDPWHNLRIRRMARDLGLQAYVSATWHSAATSQWTRLGGYSRETFAYLLYRVLHR
jgi:vancomycin permeability regulator SanA